MISKVSKRHLSRFLKPLILCGPSGVGKSSIIDHLV
jgi:putative ribosome biogenesis GTPase RsgA